MAIKRPEDRRPPRRAIRVAKSRIKRWRHLIVGVSGGGTDAHDALLLFDGSSYPANPSVAPAEPIGGVASGDILIPEFDNLTEGKSSC